MKRLLFGLFLVFAVCQSSVGEVEWLTDLPSALEKARAENKAVLLDFTGSDWCGWCMKLKSEVFDQPEFAQYARTALVMVELDFPHHKLIPALEQEANAKLAKKYNIEGYPTIILLDSSGAKIGEAGYEAGGARHYIEYLRSRAPSLKPWSPSAPEVVNTPEEPKPHAPPAFVPIAPAAPTHYDGLALKAISGAKGRRMALINNETLMVGEKAKVHVRDTKVEVTCKEIRDDSVIVILDGKEVELKLGEHL